jgi:hypothetical protein
MNAEERYRNEAHVLTRERDEARAEVERLRAEQDAAFGRGYNHAWKEREAEVERLQAAAGFTLEMFDQPDLPGPFKEAARRLRAALAGENI